MCSVPLYVFVHFFNFARSGNTMFPPNFCVRKQGFHVRKTKKNPNLYFSKGNAGRGKQKISTSTILKVTLIQK